MFRIAEEHTQTIKKNPDEKYFVILEKIDFQNFKIFKIFKNQKIEKNIWKSKFEGNRKFQIILKFSISPKFRFFRILLKIVILNFLKFWKSIFSKMKNDFSSGFFKIVLVYSSAILNMYLEHPWYLQNDIIRRTKPIVFF